MIFGTTLVYILYLNPKFRLRLQNATSVQKKTWITEWLFDRPRVVTPKLHAQLALRNSVVTGNDQLYRFLTFLATFSLLRLDGQ